MRWSIVLILGGLVIACGGDTSSDPGDAGEFSKQSIETMIRGQWGRSYDELHPEHQAIIPRELYIECNSRNSFPAYEIEVDDVFEETYDVARLGEVETMAITMKLTAGESSEFLTRHLVDVDGEWKWIANSESLDAYEQGNCP